MLLKADFSNISSDCFRFHEAWHFIPFIGTSSLSDFCSVSYGASRSYVLMIIIFTILPTFFVHVVGCNISRS